MPGLTPTTTGLYKASTITGLYDSGGVPSFVPSINGTNASAFYDFTQNQGYSNNAQQPSSTSDFSISRASVGYDLLGTTLFSANQFRRTSTGLLIEEARTNLLLQSTFAASWTGPASVTINAATAPDGTMTALLWQRTATSSQTLAQNVSKAASSLPYSVSVFASFLAGRYLAIRLQGTSPARANVVFDLQNGIISQAASVGTGFSSPSATITPAGNGFYNCSLTATSDTAVLITSYFSFNNTNVQVDGSDSSTTANGYLWGAQLEQAAFPTSYIPTTSTSATRAADVIQSSVLLGLLNNPAFATISEIVPSQVSSNFAMYTASDSSGALNRTLGYSEPSRSSYRITSGGNAATVNATTNVAAANAISKYGVSASVASGVQAGLNGTTAANAAVPAMPVGQTSAYLGATALGASIMSGLFRKLTVYNRALTNLELQTVTT